MIRSLVASAALVGLMGLAPAPPPAQDDLSRCFYPSQIERIGNDVSPTVRYFQASRGRVYRLETEGACFTPSTRVLRIAPHVATSNRVCSGDQLRVATTVSNLPRTCLARLSEQVTDPTEVRGSGLGLTGSSSN